MAGQVLVSQDPRSRPRPPALGPKLMLQRDVTSLPVLAPFRGKPRHGAHEKWSVCASCGPEADTAPFSISRAEIGAHMADRALSPRATWIKGMGLNPRLAAHAARDSK